VFFYWIEGIYFNFIGLFYELLRFRIFGILGMFYYFPNSIGYCFC